MFFLYLQGSVSLSLAAIQLNISQSNYKTKVRSINSWWLIMSVRKSFLKKPATVQFYPLVQFMQKLVLSERIFLEILPNQFLSISPKDFFNQISILNVDFNTGF